jgi:acyl carrier protein
MNGDFAMADDGLLTLIAGTLGIAPSAVNELSDISNTQKWDSLRQIMLMSELETHYGLELSDQAMLQSTSVAKIRALLLDRGAD